MEHREFWISLEQCSGDFDSRLNLVLQIPFSKSLPRIVGRHKLGTTANRHPRGNG
jgi:hypothetical protein